MWTPTALTMAAALVLQGGVVNLCGGETTGVYVVLPPRPGAAAGRPLPVEKVLYGEPRLEVPGTVNSDGWTRRHAVWVVDGRLVEASRHGSEVPCAPSPLGPEGEAGLPAFTRAWTEMRRATELEVILDHLREPSAEEAYAASTALTGLPPNREAWSAVGRTLVETLTVRGKTLEPRARMLLMELMVAAVQVTLRPRRRPERGTWQYGAARVFVETLGLPERVASDPVEQGNVGRVQACQGLLWMRYPLHCNPRTGKAPEVELRELERILDVAH